MSDEHTYAGERGCAVGQGAEGASRMSVIGEDHKAIINAANQIRGILSSASVGWANESAKRQIRALIFSIRCTATDPYIREKAGNVESRIEILFSARKWQRHGGTQRVLTEILSACSNMASRAETLLASQSSQPKRGEQPC